MTDGAPWPLLALSVGAIVLGVLPLFWVVRRLGRAIRRRPQPAVGTLRYVLALSSGAILVGGGLAALGLAVALQTWHTFTRKTHVAEVQCIHLAPQKLRVYLVPIERDGTRGATET